ncbi:UbiA family prenyltransferase [Nocardioides sp. KIGAM211]|uniref:UbiA family prenyltransferase n=1 Tax=Nocardioides luti TaxID=2761101 RepID=A0A7X0RJS0_9ACTN|nr:UbiA family prenyltransferase [Nocardioides luti]MBB6628328.1 UbiA family prenyltransferase [Nocardioides luti]
MPPLLRAAHAGPALAVVVLAALLAVADGLAVERVGLVALAVLAGQLSVGWSNDAIDAGRDRVAGRSDKPLARGDLRDRTVWAAAVLALAACVPLSLACGWVAGLVHLGCVASAWSYNAGLKSTPWSFAPYAVSFGALVVFVSLAGRPSVLPPWWQPVAGALLGVGAHLLNVLPDLADDAATGVHGLPHRLGARWLPPVATGVLVAGSLVVALGAGIGRPAVVAGLVVVLLLAAVAARSRGRAGFLSAVGIALADVVLLVLAGR